jgi:hypothetical protein
MEMRFDRRFGVWAEPSVECGGHEDSLGVLGSSIATVYDRNVKASSRGKAYDRGTLDTNSVNRENYLEGKNPASIAKLA